MTDWVSSYGGPLICVEQNLAPSWGGIVSLSVYSNDVSNDYERACQTTTYTKVIPLRVGSALVLGGEPMDTAVRIRKDGIFMIRAMYCEPDFDPDAVLESLDNSFFAVPEEMVDFFVASSSLALFDSSCPGDEMDRPCIFPIPLGQYRVLTKRRETELDYIVVHRFDRIA